MDDPGRMGVHHWANFDLKHNLREHPALKLMDMVQERDAAIAERDTAVVEKKTAFAERESAFLQRDVAVADRNAAWMERDAAVMALSMVRAGKDYREVAAKLMQMVNMAVPVPIMEANLHGFSKSGQESDQQGKQPGKKGSTKKRKFSAVPSQNTKSGSKSPSKKKQKQKAEQGTVAKTDKHRNDEEISNYCDALVPFYATGVTPIPYCSCTGANQQCYRWGKGGWQSACCTNFLSMYPLPMNPVKRSSRVPGRKMSGSAFKKLLERLAAEGVDISASIDLKNYWAKHGTNRYATIK
ncbi:hypothetical protein L7F22_006694 [Adiantum nelumboides]|nr:hypothetical protein [Adiantum nelumboides]